MDFAGAVGVCMHHTFNSCFVVVMVGRFTCFVVMIGLVFPVMVVSALLMMMAAGFASTM